MNKNNLNRLIQDRVYDVAKQKLQVMANRFQTYLKYEISVSNTELALSNQNHGYDFKSIPDIFADEVVISTPEMNGGKVGLSITIPQQCIDKVSEQQLAYFKKYVLSNVVTKMKNGY